MENRNSNNNNRQREDFEEMGFPVHSQVRKIKQESEKIIDWLPGKPEMRPVLGEITMTRQISRSPLGISC
ncbi:unnamed protein product [Prunus armeniaca]|uniref:Uncharacterized protein n=1 Tax=Prunus armeniaca TaxID=36596 RepID=A0A6J5UZS4_PRUAR|nr:hypothetical protein GBA52_017966 [Prunus armeniaca]CAB4281423.1 unnamed protein product [Prunus armeniaca]CAB4311833.1 unnamed protein product [Prunus armeniaca]